MTPRLILAVISTFFEETALVVIWRWGLPAVGIQLPSAVLAAAMLAWAVFSVTIFRVGSRVLRRQAMIGLTSMVGSRGKVASRLEPGGLIMVRGELWRAESAEGDTVNKGEPVKVVGQDGLKLTVRRE